MREKLTALWQMIESQLRIVMFLVFMCLLGAVFFLKKTETSDASVWQPTPQPTPVPAGAEVSQVIRQNLYPETSLIESFPYSPLAVSMFSFKNVQDEVEKEETVQRLYTEAAALSTDGQHEQALKRCEEALAIRPNYLDALKLKKSLEEKLAPAATPTPAAP